MKKVLGRITALLAVWLVAASLAGCSLAAKPYLVAGSSLSIGEAAPIANLNYGIGGSAAAMQASLDLNTLTEPAFYTPDASGNLVANTDFGSVTADSATKITYKLTGKAAWSDGVPVSAADLALSYLQATQSPAVATSDPVAGNTYFGRAQAGTSLALATGATVSGNTLTVTFAHPIADFKTALRLTVPAHLVGKLALGNTAATASDGENLVLGALADLTGGTGDWVKVTNVLGTSFAASSTDARFDASAMVTAGAYQIVSGTSSKLVLKANPSFTWGPKPTIQNVTILGFNNTDELIAALAAHQVDLASPQSSTSQSISGVVQQLRSAGLQLASGRSGDLEVAVLNHSHKAAFDPANYLVDPKRGTYLGQAMFNFLPRAGIWNTLLMGNGLTKADSLALTPGDANYASAVQQNGSQAYQFQNVEATQELWQKTTIKQTVKIRVLFDANNPRGQLEYSQLATYNVLGGLTISNVSSADPSQVLTYGQWDLFITTIPALKANPEAIGALLALSGVSDSKVDGLVAKLAKDKASATDSATLVALDTALQGDYVALPIFELPKLVVNSKRMVGYKADLGAQSLATGYPNWAVKAPSK